MGLSPALKSEFLALLDGLAPGADASKVVAFVREHWDACEQELGALPGFDQVRAGVLRALPALGSDIERGPLWDAVDRALEAFAPSEDEPETGVRRHPAWVGVCALELAHQRDGDFRAGLHRAERLSTVGFVAAARFTTVARGEVLWAIAEAADDVGWTDLSDPLLEMSVTSPFAEEENLGKVRLLQALRLLDAEDDRAAGAIDAILAMDELDPQTQTHALWIGAHLDRIQGDMGRAIDRLEQALALVDPEDEPDVYTRVKDALMTFGGRSEVDANA